MIICSMCGRDIDALGQDNCSCEIGSPLCEDCANEINFKNPYFTRAEMEEMKQKSIKEFEE